MKSVIHIQETGQESHGEERYDVQHDDRMNFTSICSSRIVPAVRLGGGCLVEGTAEAVSYKTSCALCQGIEFCTDRYSKLCGRGISDAALQEPQPAQSRHDTPSRQFSLSLRLRIASINALN